MVDIGVIGLDTSHAEAFAETLAAGVSADLTAVWDGGDVRSDAYAREFCEHHGATRYDDPHEMIDDVDAVMVLTVNWDTHRDLAVPFLERGIPTLIDKPIAGRIEDVRALEDAADGTPLFGGSAVPYHPDVESFDPDPNGQVLYCVGYDDPFYYGVHLVDTLCRIVDAEWATVSPADDPGRTVDVVFEDGTYATVRLDSPGEEKQFSFLSIGNRTTSVEIGNTPEEMAAMYRSYLQTFLDVVDGRGRPGDRVLNAAELLLGMDASLTYDRPITPNCRALRNHEVDGRAFLEEYSPYY